MKVVAKKLGEHPQGIWRQPGDKFEYDGKEPALWMVTAEEAEKAEAEAKEEAETKSEIVKAQAEAAAKVKANAKAKKAGAKKAETPPAPEPVAPPAPEPVAPLAADAEPKFKAIHRGAGKWDVFDQNLEVVEGGDNLDKAGAAALVEQLINQ